MSLPNDSNVFIPLACEVAYSKADESAVSFHECSLADDIDPIAMWTRSCIRSRLCKSACRARAGSLALTALRIAS